MQKTNSKPIYGYRWTWHYAICPLSPYPYANVECQLVYKEDECTCTSTHTFISDKEDFKKAWAKQENRYYLIEFSWLSNRKMAYIMVDPGHYVQLSIPSLTVERVP